jgi:large subunit ribosomal protein L28
VTLQVKAMVGNNVSHAMNKTKRKFSVNLVKKRFIFKKKMDYSKSSCIYDKTINKNGIAAVLKKRSQKDLLNNPFQKK